MRPVFFNGVEVRVGSLKDRVDLGKEGGKEGGREGGGKEGKGIKLKGAACNGNFEGNLPKPRTTYMKISWTLPPSLPPSLPPTPPATPW